VTRPSTTQPTARLALIVGKQGSGKTTRVMEGLRGLALPETTGGLESVHVAANHYNHLTYDADGDLALVAGVHLDRALTKVRSLRGLHALELPHSGYLPPGCDRDLNDDSIETRVFHLELPEAVWKGVGGSTGAITSPAYFMEHGRKVETRAECDYARDTTRIRDEIARSGVPAMRFDNAEAMVEPIRDYLLFSARDRWTDAQLRAFVELKMGKTRSRGFEGRTGLLGYQVVDFGNGLRSPGDTQTPEKLAFIVEAAGIPVAGRSFLDLGCNMGSILFELKKRGAGECVGIDVYEPALDVARALNDHWFRFADVRFVSHSIVDDWSTAPFWAERGTGRLDYALALSVLHKDGVRERLDEVVRNIRRFATNLIAEIPIDGDTPEWDHRGVRALLDAHYRVRQLPSSDFHSVCNARDLLLCETP